MSTPDDDVIDPLATAARPHRFHTGERATDEVGLSGPVDSVRRVLVAALAALDHDIAAKRIPVEAAT